jgi:Flp pilus assembly protein TadD
MAARHFEIALEHALALAERDDLGRAVDLLRMLALANPTAPEVWDALADCHDRASDPATAGALREVGKMLSSAPP